MLIIIFYIQTSTNVTRDQECARKEISVSTLMVLISASLKNALMSIITHKILLSKIYVFKHEILLHINDNL